MADTQIRVLRLRRPKYRNLGYIINLIVNGYSPEKVISYWFRIHGYGHIKNDIEYGFKVAVTVLNQYYEQPRYTLSLGLVQMLRASATHITFSAHEQRFFEVCETSLILVHS